MTENQFDLTAVEKTKFTYKYKLLSIRSHPLLHKVRLKGPAVFFDLVACPLFEAAPRIWPPITADKIGGLPPLLIPWSLGGSKVHTGAQAPGLGLGHTPQIHPKLKSRAFSAAL